MNENKFGIQVMVLREKMHITKKQLGMMVGVSDTTIGRWENGKSKPQSTEVIERLISVANGLS